MTQIKTLPDRVEFSLPFSDNSGDRIKVLYLGKCDIVIEDFEKRILVCGDDIQWLIDVLQDAKGLIQEREAAKMKKPEDHTEGFKEFVEKIDSQKTFHMFKENTSTGPKAYCGNRAASKGQLFFGEIKNFPGKLCKNCLKAYTKGKEEVNPPKHRENGFGVQ